MTMMEELGSATRESRAWACYDCGKCTATCPVARAGSSYSPRKHVLAANLGQSPEPSLDGSISSCLTCGLCDRRCPADVGYTDLVQKLREISYRGGVEPECPHGGALQSVMRMMATGQMKQDRLSWLTSELKTEPAKGDVFYWTGCTMYFDALFPELDVSTLGSTRAAIRLLNELGVTPVVSPDERCCGHDLLWNGDREGFERLARHNVNLVIESGASTLITSCAECMRTWTLDYASFMGKAKIRVTHITQYLSEHMSGLKLRPNGSSRVTFQDPCRMGRHLGVYEPPRQVLSAVPGVEVVEMRRSGGAAICCAGGTWSNCDRFAKCIQVERLTEARSTGAEILAAACPKCQIHLRCAMKDPKLKERIEIETKDVAEIVAERLLSDLT